MAKEYEMLTSELHTQARESLRLRANAASSEHALMTLKECLQLVKSEEIVAAGEVVSLRTEGLRQHQHLHDRIGAGFQEQQHLRNRLDEEEEFRSMAMQRMQKAEEQLWQVENNAKHTLPTLHGELNELRRALKLQEDVQARTLSELEAARNAHQGFRQPSSSIPISSRTTESGWECVSRDRVQAFPVGAEIRSPEVHTPSQSPVNREVFNFVGSSQHTTEGAAPEHLVPRADSRAPERFAQRAASSSSSPEKSVTTTSEDAKAVRDRQLRDLLMTLGMRERVASSSSSTAVKGVSYDGDPSSEHATASTVDPAHAARLSVLEQQIEEMRNEMQKAQKAEQRLRIDRDEWRLMAENLQAPAGAEAEEEEEDEGDHDDEGFHDAHGGGPDPGPDDGSPGGSPSKRGRRGPGSDPPDGEDPDGGDDPEYTDVKISRREADKVVVPPFPTVTHLDSWMSQCLANVLSACADPNQEEWMKWLSPAFRPNPDIEALNDSGHKKFRGIDVKLGVAMSAMLRAGSDKAAELYLEVNRKANDYVRSYDGKIIKGRQIIAMMYESFRTRDRLDMIVSLDYLVKLQFQGDNKLHQFKQTWLEILNRMRPEDVPSEMALRDLLHSKIKDSPGMKFELGLHYENLTYDDPKRSYKHLMNIIDRTIMRRREQSNLTQTQIGLRQMLEGKDLLAAPAKPTPPPPTGGKPNKGNGKPDDAAPVLPQSKAKAHAKGKGKPKKNTRSTSTDSKPDKSKKHIRCKFHFTDAGCRNGDKCPFSHSKTTPETPSRSRTPSPSGRSGNQICFTFRKTGSCSRENCPFKHEAAPATPAAKAEAEAEAKAKAKAEAKAKSKPGAAAKKAAKSKAKPAAPAIRMCRAWNPSAPAIWKRSSYIADDESECSSIDSDVVSDCSTDDEAFGTASPTKLPKHRQVSFTKDVRFQSTKPRRSYKDRGQAVVKVDVTSMVNGADRATELEFAKHKARLKAQIMKDMVDDEGDGDRITYVRLSGTSQVAEVAIYDGEDQIMERNLTAVDSKRVIDKGVFRCMVQPVILCKKIKFLMDTGCGHDLISKKKIEKHDLETLVTPEPISFQTANGITDTDLASNFQADSFKEPINAYVLGDTPSVLSVGKRCMNQNYSFIWPPGREPFMIDPDGKSISLFVNGDIPYMSGLEAANLSLMTMMRLPLYLRCSTSIATKEKWLRLPGRSR